MSRPPGLTAVQFAALQDARQDLNAGWMAISQQLDDLRVTVKNLQASWTGIDGAAETYQHYQKQWDNAANDLANTLNLLGAAVDSAHDNYHGAEMKNINLFRLD
jgi:WXG100 family type VII secretion target